MTRLPPRYSKEPRIDPTFAVELCKLLNLAFQTDAQAAQGYALLLAESLDARGARYEADRLRIRVEELMGIREETPRVVLIQGGT